MAASRSEAQAAIESGTVTVGGMPTPKPATLVDDATSLRLVGPSSRFVSRGGEKLAGALDTFDVAVAGRHCLDAGASTGGFSDCLLQHGASPVVALDVGYGQLAWGIRNDPRVRVVERTNLRYVDPADIHAPFEVIVADLSFISLCTVGAALAACSFEDTDFVLLVKPQFEAGKGKVGKGGIVRDPKVHREVLDKVIGCLEQSGIGAKQVIRSPIRGAGGNREFFLWARQGRVTVDDEMIAKVVHA
ncbi:MAG: TlyA family rRNA (cytidine-2'-O)-methyltransferase [Gammaproteobacteria bacterium]|nr:TlyA family rRNA (cytidine-2'-O)-methyltransferase [Gammaproteobacteria bacterium]